MSSVTQDGKKVKGTGTKGRKAAKEIGPVNGRSRWLKVPALPGGVGRIRITAETRDGEVTKEYDLAALTAEDGTPEGWRLMKDDPAAPPYDLRVDLEGHPCSCDCGDWEFRRSNLNPRTHGCKHIRGVAAALRKIGWIN